MSLVSLSKVCDITAGQSAPQDSDAFGPEGHPFIRAGSLDALTNGGSENDCEHLTEEKAQQYRMRLFPKDTIVFAKSGMSAKIGRVYRLKTPAYIVSHLAAVTPGEDVDPSYLQRWFERNPPSRLIPNEAYPSIRMSEIGDLKIELPKKSDQKRNADILDKADAIRRKRKQAIHLADEFLRSVFLDMFGDPITNRKKWPIQKGRDVFGVLQYGTSSKSEVIQSTESMPVLRIPNVVNGDVSLEGMKYGKFTSAEEERLQLQCGDLLFVRTNGNPDYIARCAIFQLKGKYAFASYLIRGRIADEAGFNPEFIHALVSSSSYRKFLIRETRTTAGNFNISAEGIRNLPFIQPPFELQNGYLTIRQRVYAMHKRYGESSAIADNSFQSLSQRAFRGDL